MYLGKQWEEEGCRLGSRVQYKNNAARQWNVKARVTTFYGFKDR